MIPSAVYSELNAFFNAKEKGVSFQEFIEGIHKYELMDAEGDKVCDDDELINFLTDNSIDYEFVSLHKSTYGDVYMIFTYFYIYLLPQCKKGSKYYVDFSKLTRYRSFFECQIEKCSECNEELHYAIWCDYAKINGEWKYEKFPVCFCDDGSLDCDMYKDFVSFKYDLNDEDDIELMSFLNKAPEGYEDKFYELGSICPECSKTL
jgi:hypothetical protein